MTGALTKQGIFCPPMRSIIYYSEHNSLTRIISHLISGANNSCVPSLPYIQTIYDGQGGIRVWCIRIIRVSPAAIGTLSRHIDSRLRTMSLWAASGLIPAVILVINRERCAAEPTRIEAHGILPILPITGFLISIATRSLPIVIR